MENIIISTELQQLITADQAWHYKIIPKSQSKDLLEFYITSDSNDDNIKNELELIFNKPIKYTLVPSEIINRALSTYFRNSKVKSKSSHHSDVVSDDFLKKVIYEAFTLKSSDIHIEIYQGKCRIRFRIDGQLIERYILKKEEYPQIINKVKISANLDIAEKRLPQDGRILFEHNRHKIDMRVSILPTLFGEKVVLRLLTKDSGLVDINNLGLSEKQISDYLLSIKRPNGIILISGPTGSGKTTTLYATLKMLNNEHSNILTIEDPIEYTLEGINQVQLKEDIGLTFASALRTFLRQDPDIIMVGEIRDSETAQMAIRAALTGHLVLSTIHTNSAWGSISRLIDMGVPSFLLANTINLTAAQRLVRVLCPNCKEKVMFVPEKLPQFQKLKNFINYYYTPIGCEKCFYTGYKGRKALYEIIPIDFQLTEFIKLNQQIPIDVMKARGISLLFDSAVEMINTGETSLDEVLPILINSF